MYDGASPYSALYVSRHSFNWTCCETGSSNVRSVKKTSRTGTNLCVIMVRIYLRLCLSGAIFLKPTGVDCCNNSFVTVLFIEFAVGVLLCAFIG